MSCCARLMANGLIFGLTCAPKQSKDAKNRLEKDPSAGIMDLMKDMYNSGDDKMRETIGKAMLESRKRRQRPSC